MPGGLQGGQSWDSGAGGWMTGLCGGHLHETRVSVELWRLVYILKPRILKLQNKLSQNRVHFAICIANGLSVSLSGSFSTQTLAAYTTTLA